MSNGILRDCEFASSDEIEEAIARAWDDSVQSVFPIWRGHPAWVIENGGEQVCE
jgi:hypothetical protein